MSDGQMYYVNIPREIPDGLPRKHYDARYESRFCLSIAEHWSPGASAFVNVPLLCLQFLRIA